MWYSYYRYKELKTKLTYISFVNGNVEAAADMLTLRGRGQGPCLSTRELGLPRWQANTVNLIEER